MEIMQGQTLLLQVVGALHAASSFASGLHGWQQQSNQNTDDGNHHQQFDQGETAAVPSHNVSNSFHLATSIWKTPKILHNYFTEAFLLLHHQTLELTQRWERIKIGLTKIGSRTKIWLPDS
jgi:hypothetical protein